MISWSGTIRFQKPLAQLLLQYTLITLIIIEYVVTYFLKHSVLLKLTTDRHEASRSLSATAELLVMPADDTYVSVRGRRHLRSDCSPD